jgi:hypothetical protein
MPKKYFVLTLLVDKSEKSKKIFIHNNLIKQEKYSLRNYDLNSK